MSGLLRNLQAAGKARIAVLFAGLLLLSSPDVRAQERPVNGIADRSPEVYALINARIVASPGVVINRGTIVIRDGRFEAVSAAVQPPPDARVRDCRGLTLYPGLIEMSSPVRQSRPDPKPAAGGAALWNRHVRSERRIADELTDAPVLVENLRALGFSVAVSAPSDGIFQGTSAVVSLGNGTVNENLISDRFAQHVSFTRGSSTDEYPSSLMGIIALMRQTLFDADWYQRSLHIYLANPIGLPRPDAQASLAALESALQRQPVVIRVSDEHEALRAGALAREFNLHVILAGSGSEYKRLPETTALGLPVILPVNFPAAPAVQTADDAMDIDLRDLQHYELAPRNPALLQAAGWSLALTTSGLDASRSFPAAVRKAIEHGFSEDAALAALTTTPARLLGLEDRIGTIAPGKAANLCVSRGRLFSSGSRVVETWVDGQRYPATADETPDVQGEWTGTASLGGARSRSFEMTVSGETAKLKALVKIRGDESIVSKVWLDAGQLHLIVDGDELGDAGPARLSGKVTGNRITGEGQSASGLSLRWALTLEKPAPIPDAPIQQLDLPKVTLAYPLGAFGRVQPPEQPSAVLVRNATIWTCGPQGLLEKADLLVRNGRITAVGTDLEKPSGAVEINGTGKHVTPGLIDCHSHIAILRGVNETAYSNTAEVRVEDVLNPDDMTIYRQMAGGLTTALTLHGSANAVGGQNQVIKLRWGAPADSLKFTDAPPTLKFALGENPKRSNWGEPNRYPATRMGVEQVLRDAFQAADDYRYTWQVYQATPDKSKVLPPRRNLQLEALVEVMENKRHAHCHTYRQDETLMMMRIAEEFGFTVDVFVHALEGYKVADQIARHGASATTFSDWWGYKFEVYDAIPYNGVLMHDANVLVSYNSDDDELGRRMNLEAAKAVKYGGLTEETALRFVTINPARQLGVGDRVGSLEAGKDADFVLWSGSPLSTLSRCEQTWIDGRRYFDIEADRRMQEHMERERNRLIRQILAGEGGSGNGPDAVSTSRRGGE